MKTIDIFEPRVPAADELPDESLRPDLREPTFSFPIWPGFRIEIELRPGWWIIVAAPLTIIIALAVMAYCLVTTDGPLQ